MHSIITELRRLIVKREKHTQTERDRDRDREPETERHTCREYEYYIKKKFYATHIDPTIPLPGIYPKEILRTVA